MKLGKAEASTLNTDLIVHHGVTDVLNQAVKFTHILGAVQEPCDLSPPFQWDEVLENVIQFPGKLYVSDWVSALERFVTV